MADGLAKPVLGLAVSALGGVGFRNLDVDIDNALRQFRVWGCKPQAPTGTCDTKSNHKPNHSLFSLRTTAYDLMTTVLPTRIQNC